MSMTTFFIFVGVVALAAIAMSGVNFKSVMKVSEGNFLMASTARKIREGANVFLKQEYKVLIPVVFILAILFSFAIYPLAGVAFALGAIMSGFTGFYGMQMSTRANVRVTNAANNTRSIGAALKVAFKGGSVMGLSVQAFALLGLAIVMLISKNLWADTTVIVNFLGFEISPLSIVLFSYGLGCSIIALFNRVGGGIYTKAADMGSDLVGKSELHLAEDDPRNAGVIADNTGDNANDIAGLGSDLLESFMGSGVGAMVLVRELYTHGAGFNMNMLYKMMMYPVAVAALGLVSCMIGIVYLSAKKVGADPHKELNLATWLSAGLTAICSVALSIFFFSGENVKNITFFTFGIVSPCLAILVGIATGITIGMVAEYYTSFAENGKKPRPTNVIAAITKEGAALTITEGLSVGMNSILPSVIVLVIGLLVSYGVCGYYGTALAAVGMLSFVAMTVSVDSYGPIADNAGGIAEMAGLSPEVRAITDKLDAVGNTTAAIGKGFAIGSATYTTVSLLISYLFSITSADKEIALNIMNIFVMGGLLLGSAIVWRFSGILISAVTKAAGNMVDEIRRQFREIPGLADGKEGVEPDYNKCIEISTKGSLSEMKTPALISILVPLGTGFIFGAEFVGGLLFGATLSAIVLAIFCGNAGGAWDNAKKAVESLENKGGPERHSAAVVGDTVGDPLKDTVGPSLDINIKFMSTISLLFAPFFMKFNLVDLLMSLFK